MRKSYNHKKKVPFYKKKQFFTIMIAVFFVMLMALSAVNLGQNNEEDDASSNAFEAYGLTFVQSSNGYEAELSDGSVLSLIYDPSQLDDVGDASIVGSLASFVYVEKVYLSSDLNASNLDYALYDFQRNVALPSSVSLACYEEGELCEDLPLKTCEDASESVGVIVWKEAEETSVSLVDNCLTIEGKNLLKVTDKLLIENYG